MAELVLTRRARRDLAALPPSVHEAVMETLTLVETDPTAAGKQLVGRLRGLWSCPVGSYRILYTVEPRRTIVRAVKHRGTAYG